MERPFVGGSILKEVFAEMPAGKQVRDLFESYAEKSDRFAVLVNRIDDFDKLLDGIGEGTASGIAVSLAGVIEGLRKTHPMEWGRMDDDQFVCFCPDMDEGAAVELAKKIQNSFTPSGKQTVSIGIAVYPFWPFEKAAILANAQKALDHASFFGPGTITTFDAVSLNISADKLYQYGDIDGAIDEFKKALAVDPQNVNVFNSLGVCYGVQGKLDLAVEAFEAAIHLEPKDVMATYNLGLAHLRQGDEEKALELFLEAHRLDGNNPEVCCQIGMYYRDKGEAEAALEYLEKAARNTQKGGHVFRVLADCYLEREMLHEATKAYEKAVKANPADAKSLSALGHLYGTLGENIEIAIVLAKESTALEPNNGLYRYRLGKLYLQNQDHKKAAKELKMALKMGEDCTELLLEAESAVGEAR
ncbi:MAG: tetratricopeptide repeat protein [Thermodesulfobacteriota bacterium]|nr:tetratricopeptide repeat protein [Thermodesulfobacteriota bacterium]